MNFENGTVAIVSGIRGNVMNGRTSRSSMRFAWVAIGVALGLTTAGCGSQKESPSSDARAPRAAAELRTDGPQCGGTDVHTKHIDLSFGCATCHPCGAVFGFDVPFTFPLGTTTAGGTLTRGATPGTSTCAVACHSPMGAPLKTVAWSAGPQDCTSCHLTSTFPPVHPAIANPNPTGADCLGCHTTGSHTTGTVTLVGHAPAWMVQADPGFHAFQANLGLGKCQGCHAADLSGGKTGFSCAQCHDVGLPAGVASWKVNCVMCHGGTGNQTGAPPKATWGNSADLARVGAHATHMAGTATSPAAACSACHTVPADALAAGHVDGATATLTWSGMSVTGGAVPAWDRPTATCSNTYCHGGFTNGATANSPVWTSVGSGQAACGTCHGLPPGGTHPVVSSALTGCNVCHPATMNTAGALLTVAAGGKHLDGIIQATGGGHPAGWSDPNSAGFHAASANSGIAACTSCHGATLDGGIATACGTCHDRLLPVGVTTWKKNCTMCHGGTNNATGAPPKATWGNTADAVRAGAHSTHVTASASGAAIACSACHVTPADALSAGHLDGTTASVTWGGVSIAYGATPAWSRTGATCSNTYCHGNFPNGNRTNAPVWTAVGTGQGACGTCHGLPPGGTHPAASTNLADCSICHPDSMNATGVLIAASAGGKHLDGVIQALGGHDASWMVQASPGFHAYSANNGLANCQGCHGTNLDGVGSMSTVSCATCHGATWKTTCTMCHGGTGGTTGAPPKNTWGNSADAVRTGAHATHITAGARWPAFPCAACHVMPANALSAGHVDSKATADVTWGDVTVTGGATPTWNRTNATCSNTYCHGRFANGSTFNAPVWTGTGQGACGSCHGLPPGGSHPAVSTALATCGSCHAMAIDATGVLITPAAGGTHMDGKTDVAGTHPAGWVDMASPVGGTHGKNLWNGQGTISMGDYYQNCTKCHGNNAGEFTVTGGTSGIACDKCHTAFIVKTQPVGNLCGGTTTVPCTSCTWCHQ